MEHYFKTRKSKPLGQVLGQPLKVNNGGSNCGDLSLLMERHTVQHVRYLTLNLTEDNLCCAALLPVKRQNRESGGPLFILFVGPKVFFLEQARKGLPKIRSARRRRGTHFL